MSPVLQSATHQHCAKGGTIEVLVCAQCLIVSFAEQKIVCMSLVGVVLEKMPPLLYCHFSLSL